LTFPVGAFLMTGTGLVPEGGFTLADGDVVAISVDGLGSLENRVRRVGSAGPG
jgi:2-dehydro-3-deoxy-D-arabinonate dehydratase